jgi:hypothetical protein
VGQSRRGTIQAEDGNAWKRVGFQTIRAEALEGVSQAPGQ